LFGLRQELAGLVNSGSPKYVALVSEPATASEPYGRLIVGTRLCENENLSELIWLQRVLVEAADERVERRLSQSSCRGRSWQADRRRA